MFSDLGISAFSGANVTTGKMGMFIKAAEEGMVPFGSVLIVESLDRLSRQSVFSHLSMFLDLINLGITLVTLMDNKKYTKEGLKNDPGELRDSIAIMQRAHDESLTKSKRGRAAWEAKRQSGKVLTKICPAWLTWNPTSGRFETIEKRVEIVQRIFAMASDGWGRDAIARRLNEEGLPAWRSTRGWHPSYIGKILQNRATLGEFEPNSRVDGKRQGLGKVRENYYPAIISPDIFYVVQARRNQHLKFIGKNGSNSTANLFTGIAVCGYTGYPMVYSNKDSKKGKWRYLVSDHAKRKLGSKSFSWPYEKFETEILINLTNLDLGNVLKLDADKCRKIAQDLDARRGEMESVQGRINELSLELQESSQSVKTLIAVVKTMELKYDRLEKEVRELEDEQMRLKAGNNYQNYLELLGQFAARNTDPDIRVRLKTEIRSKVKQIRVFGHGPPAGEDVYRFENWRYFEMDLHNGLRVASQREKEFLDIGNLSEAIARQLQSPPHLLLNPEGEFIAGDVVSPEYVSVIRNFPENHSDDYQMEHSASQIITSQIPESR